MTLLIPDYFWKVVGQEFESIAHSARDSYKWVVDK